MMRKSGTGLCTGAVEKCANEIVAWSDPYSQCFIADDAQAQH
jgi:hypothetical protein